LSLCWPPTHACTHLFLSPASLPFPCPARPRQQVRLWDTATSTCAVTLQGHKSAVSALRYSAAGDLLASGGRDTDVIVWDVVGEAGLYRLRGHKDQVTDLVRYLSSLSLFSLLSPLLSLPSLSALSCIRGPWSAATCAALVQ
jgi:U3 small nucleolar RNA-associated protein 12